MVSLNDYLYAGNTVLKILHNYSDDLKKDAARNGNIIDKAHCDFLLQQIDMLEHNEFLTSQSQRIKEFYKHMASEYPYLAFTFKGRIKSLVRAEAKFNGYIVEYIYDYYKKHGSFPDPEGLIPKLSTFRDLIAYRIVISLPNCHLGEGQKREKVEREHLYRIANELPGFLEERDFAMQPADIKEEPSIALKEELRPYYKDYVENPSPYGYQSLHITFFDRIFQSYAEIQIRTKDMDDFAEIGPANHLGYEKRQKNERTRRDEIPKGECIYFDEAFERELLLQNLDLSKIDVNMFKAVNNSLINDGCGFFRGRQILPFEHLSRFQNDMID